jgi:hypothetical protein
MVQRAAPASGVFGTAAQGGMGTFVVVRSNRGGEGKTLLAQLLVEYLVESRADWVLYSSTTRDSGYAGSGGERCFPLAIGDTRSMVRFVDAIQRHPAAWTLLDLAHVDDRRFVDFCDITGAVTELADTGVATLSFRVYAPPARDVKTTFWAESLIDAREMLVLNNFASAHLREWRDNPERQELVDERVPEFVIPRVDELAVRHFLSRRTLMHDYLVDHSGTGVDVFARVQLARLVHAFHTQFKQFLLSRDLLRLNDPLFQ